MQVHITLRYLRGYLLSRQLQNLFFLNMPILNSRKTRKAVSYIPQKKKIYNNNPFDSNASICWKSNKIKCYT